ncbi:MAG: integrase [Rhodospirillaceae bacterium]
MATIRKRGRRWQVQIRLAGVAPASATFANRQEAQKWAREMEGRAPVAPAAQPPVDSDLLTLRKLIERYRENVTVHKRGRLNEECYLTAILREPFADAPLSALDASAFAAYRDRLARRIKGASVRKYLTLLSHIYTIARAEWAIAVANPLAHLRRPPAGLPRDRRLQPGEWDALIVAADACRNAVMRPLIEFAVESAMRRGEILRVEFAHRNAERRTLHIPTTKTARPRTIALTPAASRILDEQQAKGYVRPFPTTGNAIRLAWQRIVKRAGIHDLHFHDLRHEAISRLFERGLTIPETALVSGHSDPRQLFRYTHLRAEDVAAKLWRSAASAAP